MGQSCSTLGRQSAVNLLTNVTFLKKTDIIDFESKHHHPLPPDLEPNLTHLVYPGRSVWTFTFEIEEISSNFIK